MPLQHPAFSSPRLALLALAALLSGCASLTSPTTALPATPTPAEWSTPAPYASSPASAAPLTANWWQGFNDPQLTALVTQALQNSTDVRSAQSALLQARALRDVSAAGLGPSVSTSASAQRSKSGGSQAGNSFQAGFDASWEPDVFGGNRSALNAAQSDVEAAVASLANAQVSLAAETAVTYIELRGLQAQLLIARGNLASQRETLQITRWRAQAGLASSLDVEQGIAASEQTGAQIPALETSIAQAASSLAVLTGESPGALRSALANAAPVPQAAGDLALAIPAETLRQRPDVRAAEHRIEAALARVAQADAARYPGFQISGSLGLRALTLGTLTSGASVANALLASVSVPLFDGGAARAQVRAQQAALESARISYQATVLSALKDVEDALISLQGNRERLARLQAASGAAANADLLARQRYASGLIDFRAVLETQRTLLSTQDSLEATRASLSADHVRLYKALGGGWTRAPETAAH
ncbi:efflux transporter outer membrane subunit [Polaromonas naphthalenivorans]|uniref:RND efflux system, outer membrane lipoprotein, NodT family n=1 Tax=Polaromonas naphthalenivorans (strain CJ2) TaxID=365044 RepID=A1VT65_POLNA|nr:efflux transporter outer membrane subunit [Polaromonas naphthalenivorans]ABM38843.1 RND efflux system, outer membrane lipoprotein, NodT family [Polaromonas naphthalenivorans CJ2]